MLNKYDRRHLSQSDRRLRSGVLVLVVGPSGAGKDSLISASREYFAANDPFAFPTRVITRGNSPGEQHEAIDVQQFEKAASAGRYLLTWRSHGLSYAIPASILEDLARDCIVVANVSRTVITQAEALVDNVVVLHVTASPETCMRRIQRRGRESGADMRQRVTRHVLIETARSPIIEISNDGALEDAVARFTRTLLELAAVRSTRIER